MAEFDRQVVAKWAPIEWEATRGKGSRHRGEHPEPPWSGLSAEARANWLKICAEGLARIREVERDLQLAFPGIAPDV